MTRRTLRILVPVALLVFIALRFDLATAARQITHLDPMWLLAAVAVFLVVLMLRAARWLLILHLLDLRIPHRLALKAFALGFVSSAFVGEALGSFSRIYDLRSPDRETSQIAYAVVFDKTYEVLVLLTLLPIAIPILPSTSKSLSVPLAIVVAAAVIAIGAVILSPQRAGRVGSWLRLKRVQRIADLPPGLGLRAHSSVALTSLAARLAQFAYVWMLARSAGIDISWITLSAIMTVVGVALLLPISINGLGVRDLTMVGLFGLAGYKAETTLVLSFAVFAMTMIFRLLAGLVWSILPTAGRRPRGTTDA